MLRSSRSIPSLIDWATGTSPRASNLPSSILPVRLRRRPTTLSATVSLLLLLLIFSLWLIARSHAKYSADVTEGACSNWMRTHYPTSSSHDEGLSLSGSSVSNAIDVFAALTSSGGRGDIVSVLPFYHLVAFVPTGANARNRRDALRAQFSATEALIITAPSKIKTKLFFVLGDDVKHIESIRDEANEKGDIIFVPCADHDGNAEPSKGSSTTCKVVRALRFAVDSLDFLYWARVGDDAFFRFDVFLQRIAPTHMEQYEKTVFARFVPGGPLAPALSVAYGISALPRYPAGSGYIIGVSVARALAETDARIGLVDGWPEDGVAGLWLSGLNLERIDSPCFHDTALLPDADERDWSNLRGSAILGGWGLRMPWEPPPRRFNAGPCNGDSLLVHYMTPQLWEAIDANGVLNECGHMY
jgi:hypothetical protein